MFKSFSTNIFVIQVWNSIAMTCHSKNSAVPQERCSVEWWLRERVALPVWRRVDVVEVGGVGESDGDAGRSLSPPSCGRHRGGGCEEMCTDDPCADRQEICPDEASSTTPYTILSSYLHPAAFCHLRPLLLHHSPNILENPLSPSYHPCLL